MSAPLGPALPHGRFAEVLPDVFVVSGAFPMGPMMTIPRNMIVVRSGKELALVNPMRLSKQGEDELEALGTVKHLLHLGRYHETDVPYSRERFSSATYWDTKGQGERLADGAAGPLAGTRVFAFTKADPVEATMIVERAGGNVLLTCDSIQNWVDTSGCSFVGGLVARMMGFIVPAKIGPFWLKEVTRGNPRALAPDFERLLAQDFAHLLGGHGVLLKNDAKAAIANSCRVQKVRDA